MLEVRWGLVEIILILILKQLFSSLCVSFSSVEYEGFVVSKKQPQVPFMWVNEGHEIPLTTWNSLLLCFPAIFKQSLQGNLCEQTHSAFWGTELWSVWQSENFLLEQLAEGSAGHLLSWLDRGLDRKPRPVVGVTGWHWEGDVLVLKATTALHRSV